MIRASAALKLPIPDIFTPLVPVQAVVSSSSSPSRTGSACARSAGSRWRVPAPSRPWPPGRVLSDAERALRRPDRFWLNLVLTLAVLGTMVLMAEKIPPALMFMLGTALALIINYPSVDAQRQRIDAHAKARS